MRMSAIKQAIMMTIGHGGPQRITPFVIGKPGIGKSEIYRQVAEELGYHLIDLRLSQHDNTDIKGLPSINKEDGTSKWFPPDFLPIEGNKRYANHKGVILLLDELNRAPADVMQSCFQLIYDYCIGEYKLMKNCYVVAAGNEGITDNCDVNEFDAATKDRLLYLPAEENLDDWVTWAEKNGVRSEIIGFLKTSPKYFYMEIAGQTKTEQRYLTPRRWVKFSRVIDDNEKKGMSLTEICQILGHAMVGEAIPQFMQYVAELETISGRDVLKNYSKVAERIKKYELARITSLSDSVVSTLTEMHKAASEDKKVKLLSNAELENLKNYMLNHLPEDMLLGFWHKLCSSTPSVGKQFGQKYPEFDSQITAIIIKSLDASRK